VPVSSAPHPDPVIVQRRTLGRIPRRPDLEEPNCDSLTAFRASPRSDISFNHACEDMIHLIQAAMIKLHLPRLLSLAVGALFCCLSAAQINLSGVNTTGLSTSCIAVLQQSVACDPLLLQVGYGRYEDDSTLTKVCTSSCATALTTYIRRITGAYGTTRYDGGDGYFYLAAFGAESTYERYQTTCLQNSLVILSRTSS
jgi:hypothetical protein